MRLSASESVHFSERRARLRMSSERCPHMICSLCGLAFRLTVIGYTERKLIMRVHLDLNGLYMSTYTLAFMTVKKILYWILLIYILQMLSHTELCTLNIMRAERFIHSVMLVDSISELLRIRSRQAVIVL